ncbi:MAG: dihydroxy-acid dehydratase, partial [Pseudomonadota bacterium]|nr:dihydroxy-acid dehydratase [Pseudomonadota bacterium]
HNDVLTVMGRGLEHYTREPYLDGGQLKWRPAPEKSHDESILRPAGNPFSADGGLKVLKGNLGRAVIKTSSVKAQHRVVEAPVRVFFDQEDVMAAFERGELHRDVIAVVLFQGPRANGMPELHKLTPPLGVLQGLGYKVGLITDGRMSGASGKVPAAIHVTPECLNGGPLARLRDGDIVVLDSERGILEARVDPAEWAARRPQAIDLSHNRWGCGRELFDVFRANAVGPEQGAMSFVLPDVAPPEIPVDSARPAAAGETLPLEM